MRGLVFADVPASLQPLVQQARKSTYCIGASAMSIKEIKAFSAKAKEDSELGAKLKSCEKLRELLALAKDSGFNIQEELFYPPNEPQFTEEQLSLKLANALLRV